MNYSFHPEAEAEFFAAIDYYEDCVPGLGHEFSIEVYRAIQRAIDFPKAWSVVEGEIHRSLLNRFPYGVLYSVEPAEIYIVAVMHLHRDPGYWTTRL